jgi:thioredoxin-related protein
MISGDGLMKTLKWMIGAALAAGLLWTPDAEAAGEDWKTDFDAAMKKAKEDGKYVLVDFSGSDWCGWCIRLDREVFAKKEFKAYAKESLVLVLLDFPRRKAQSAEMKKQNRALLQKYGVRGFPTVLLLSPKGEIVLRTGYRRGGPEKYVEHLKDAIEKHKKEASQK